jgi:uncharacterized protein YraI
MKERRETMTLKTILLGAASAVVLSAGAANATPATADTSLNVRSGPGTQYAVVGAIPAGETVDVGRCTGSWCQVSFSGGTGFASRSHLAMGEGGAAVAAAPGYVYEDAPYADDYYDYGYADGASFGFYVSPGPRFHRGGRWDRGQAWNGAGNRWSGGTWSGGRPGFAPSSGRPGFAQDGRSFQGGSIGGRASVNAPVGMPSGGGGFRGGAIGGGAAIGGGPRGGGGGGAMRGGGGAGAVGRH